ncbi:hypothetical protein [Arcanobacterium haemolyticum]|uniref:hypothetical protein n=1 Tax=Arcanobacterium haemolyticum TaxID=28264 RepID=UPI000DE584A6|nr:hypothetical protein [Arcanobacterium haemolyticum]
MKQKFRNRWLAPVAAASVALSGVAFIAPAAQAAVPDGSVAYTTNKEAKFANEISSSTLGSWLPVKK